MSVYYNEIDPQAAEWLRALILFGHIAPGDVDERSIVDVNPDDLRAYTQCHFFAGIGVWSYALRRAGWDDDRPVWTGSCPCQPFSAAGKGGGFNDERHLWPAFHHLIAQCRPDVVLGEQVASKDGLNWLDLVHADLEGEGYAVGAVDTCAAGFGAPHIRQRLYWSALADADHAGLEGRLAERQRAGQCTAGSGGLAGGLADAAVIGWERGRSSEAGLEPRSIERPHGLRTTDGLAQPLCDGAGLDTGAGLGAQAAADREDGGVPWERLRAWEQGSLFGLGLNRSDADSAHPVATPQPAADGPDRLDDNHGDRTGRAQPSLSIGQQGTDGSQLRPGPTNGFWGASDWLHCRDGRWRPVEPGTFPLAHGAAARVGRLRGYGNAIVAPQAQAFVEAVMEAL